MKISDSIAGTNDGRVKVPLPRRRPLPALPDKLVKIVPELEAWLNRVNENITAEDQEMQTYLKGL